MDSNDPELSFILNLTLKEEL